MTIAVHSVQRNGDTQRRRATAIIWGAFLTLILGTNSNIARADVRYVNVAAASGGNGLSWATAFNRLQDALSEAAGASAISEIWVVKGTYKPAGLGGSRFSTFQLVNNLALYGGFNGNEASTNQRDPATNPTIVSGDLNGNDGANFSNHGENSYHVVIGTGTNATAVLDGFTITGGYANGAALDDKRGGGILMIGGSPTIRNCALLDNYALNDGGGVHARLSSDPLFLDCMFTGNLAGVRGGALYTFSDSDPVVEDCTFQYNRAGRGGACYSVATTGDFSGCSFDTNSATINGGAVYALQASLTFDLCAFTGNTATTANPSGFGGAVFDDNSASSFTECTFDSNNAASSSSGGALFEYFSNSTMIGCEFDYNYAGYGGGIYNSSSTSAITDCAFQSNSVAGNGGGAFNYLGESLFTNCTFNYCSAPAPNLGGHGGAVADDSTSTSYISCVFDQNYCAIGSAGGAVWEYSSNSIFDACEFNQNFGSYGGAISEWYSGISVTHCGFHSNWSDIQGGALDNFHGTPLYSDCLFEFNSANAAYPGGFGGAAHDYLTSAMFTDCSFLLNVAGPDSSGGAAFEFQSNSVFGGCEFANNDAGYAGALYNSMSTTSISNCGFLSNTAGFYGGASINYSGSPTFSNCDFSSNTAIEGGAISNYTQSAASFTDCSFSDNVATHFAGATLNSLSMPRYKGCSFQGNSVSDAYPYGFGGAAYNYYNSGRIVDCTFRANSAHWTASGGAVYIYFGSQDLIAGCGFISNYAGWGGGIFDDFSTDSQIANCRFFGNSAITSSGGGLNLYGGNTVVANCSFSGDSAFYGGGVYCQQGAASTLVNTTLSNCFTGSSIAGALEVHAGNITVANSIFWDNSNYTGSSEAAQVSKSSGGTLALNRCCVQNWTGALGGTGNFGQNPRFRNALGADGYLGTEDDDLRLKTKSPAIDRGGNSSVPLDAFDLDGDGNTTERIPIDADGQSRFVDNPLIPDNGEGTAPIIDLGAYEFHGEADWIAAAIESDADGALVRRVRNARPISATATGGSASATQPISGTSTINGLGGASVTINRSTQQISSPQPIPDHPDMP